MRTARHGGDDAAELSRLGRTWGAPTTAAGFSIAAVVGALAFWFGADGVLANLIGNR